MTTPFIPLGRACPNCNSTSYSRTRVHGVSTDVRRCTSCQTIYSTPMSRWTGALIVALGLGFGLGLPALMLTGDPVVSWSRAFLQHPIEILGLLIVGFVMIVFGIIVLFTPEQSQISSSREAQKALNTSPVINIVVRSTKAPLGHWRSKLDSRNYSVRSTLTIASGYTLLAVCALAAVFGWNIMRWILNGEVARLSLLPLAAGGYVLLNVTRYARRLSSSPRQAIRHALRRHPVVLLRAFGDDQLVCANSETRMPWWGFQINYEILTFEELIAKIFAKCGPVIALRRPQEPVPPLGASRMWLTAEWRSAMGDLLVDANLIVMIIGNLTRAPGLKDEVEHIFELGDPEKIVFIMPPVDEEECETRWEMYRNLAKEKLPEYPGNVVAVAFDSKWQPKIVRTQTRSLRSESDYQAAFSITASK